MTPREGLLVRASAATQVLVDDIDAPALSTVDEHHLATVLRLRNGERVIATDGHGTWRVCEWRTGQLVTAGNATTEPTIEHPLSVAFALTKGDKPEWTIQKLTEIGVDHIVPVFSDRSIVRWDAGKVKKNTDRFRRVAREASMQSRRVFLPDVAEPAPFRTLDLSRFALAVAGGGPLTSDIRAVAVGPEGGWSDQELALAAVTVELGPTVLRAETAALSAAVRLCSVRN